MDLLRMIKTLRRNRASLDQIYMVLAMVEAGVGDVKFFTGMDQDELAEDILEKLRSITRKFICDTSRVNHSRQNFFIMICEEFHNFTDAETLGRIEFDIQKGEGTYGFKRFDPVDRTYTESTETP